jgi:hypothetical protein
MDWIEYVERWPFVQFVASHGDGHLSSECSSAAEVEAAATELKRQIDIAANRMKMALQRDADPNA